MKLLPLPPAAYLFWLLVFIMFFTSLISYFNNESNKAILIIASRQAQERRALDIFLAECRQPVEVCAKAYDDSQTLRTIYFNKATK